MNIKSKDLIVHDIIKKFDERSSVGLEKYGKPLSSDSDSLYRWVNDVQEELMDAILYLQKVKYTLQEITEETYIQSYKRQIESDNQIDLEDAIKEVETMTHTSYPGDIKITYDIVKP